MASLDISSVLQIIVYFLIRFNFFNVKKLFLFILYDFLF